jgi:hypothetical protein
LPYFFIAIQKKVLTFFPKSAMVKISDLKAGDIVKVIHDGEEKEGEVVDVNRDQKIACVDNGTQEFWYPADQILSIPLNEEQLLKLGFHRQDGDGTIKYLKGPFRILLQGEGAFSNFDIWYREDRRHFNVPLAVHELQNHHMEMTKVQLSRL